VNTDAQGRFHFDKVSPSHYGVFWDFNTLTVTHPDYVRAQVRMDDIVAGREKSARIELQHGVVQRGTLSDADTGKPLRGFSVQADFEPRQQTQFIAYSDFGGRYELRVPKTRVTLRPGVPMGLGAQDSNYYPVVDVREVRATRAASLADVDFAFRHGRTISGKIVGGDDLAVLYLEARPADADPNWRAINRHGTTFATDGTFRITQLKPGRYDLLVTEVRDSRMRGELLTQPIVIPEKNDVDGVVLELPHTAAVNLGTDIRGTVHYADGRPARGARLDLLPDEQASLEMNHDTHASADGTFVMHGVDAQRKWTLWARDSTGMQGAAALITNPGEIAKPIELTLQPGAGFSGVVRDQDGKPLANFVVSIGDVRPDGPFTAHRNLVSTVTDDQGRYTLSGLVPPAGVTGFLLEASPNVLAERMRVPLEDQPYRDFEIKLGATQGGFDFVVEKTPARWKIIPKRSAAEAMETR
jgi:hypothetical protein